VTSKDERTATASFKAKDGTRVIGEDGKDVVPGSGASGLLAIGGRQAIGYYGDEAKSAAIFRIIDGKRYVVPGDWATVDADGVVKLLGRGSGCINTGGEKVFPEEVELVLKSHPAIYDAVVVGVPDERFGQSIAAVVEAEKGASIDAREVIEFVKGRLSSYKAPRHVMTVPAIGRGPNAKPDLNAIRAMAISHLAARTTA
jgi:fatty-acyl-CoA synthase